MLRKVKKESPSSPIVVDSSNSDSEIEYIKVYIDESPVDVVLDNNRIMMDDMIALFPKFHGLHLIGNGINKMMPKSKFAKKKYFPPPEVGWEAVKINVLIIESSPLESVKCTPRSTIPEPSELKRVVDNVKPDIRKSISPPPKVSIEDIFGRFNVTNLAQLLSLPQFVHESFFDPQSFNNYRDKYIDVYRNVIMALGPESFHLSFVFRLYKKIADVSRLLNSLNGSKAIKCDICNVAFSEPQSAFQHYCSIDHGENHLAANNCEATDMVEILKMAKEQLMFPPPVHLPSIMPKFVPPPSIIPVSQFTRFAARPYFYNHIAPPALVTTTPLLEAQRRKWDSHPTPVQLIPPPVKTIPPSADKIIRVCVPSLSTPKEKTGRDKEVSSSQLAPVTSQRETINNNREENSINHIASPSPFVPPKNGKRKRQDTEDSEVLFRPSKRAATNSQPSPSLSDQTKRAQRDSNDKCNGPRIPAAEPLRKSTLKPKESEDESSDFEVIAHVNRPIKGEFGELTICRSHQIPEKELLFHFKVRSLTELRKIRSMMLPCLIPDLDEFHRFRNFAFQYLRNVLVKAAPSVERIAYVLFMASKSNVAFNVLQEGARKKCSTCKGDEFTLGHILSQKHLILYRDKYFCDPDEIVEMLKPANQKFYIADDERKHVLREFKVQSFDMLKIKPQFCRNRFYRANASQFEALKEAFIERLKVENLRIDPRAFWLEKMLFFKYEAEFDTKLFPLLMDVFKNYERKCNVCETKISSWIEFMKHIISKAHIRKELTQAQMNYIISAMRLIKVVDGGYAVLPEAETKFQQKTNSSVSDERQKQYTDSSADDSSSSEAPSPPPDDPVNIKADSADRLKEIEKRLRVLSKHKKLTKPQLQEKQNLLIEKANLEM